VIPLWIQLPNLPLICWGPDSLSRIGSTLGKPLFADECSSKQTRISYARILIEIDITIPLLHKILVESPDEKCFEHKIAYDWEPTFCQKCQQVEHNCDTKKPVPLEIRARKDWIPKKKAVLKQKSF